jgi:SET domain-containing protein
MPAIHSDAANQCERDVAHDDEAQHDRAESLVQHDEDQQKHDRRQDGQHHAAFLALTEVALQARTIADRQGCPCNNLAHFANDPCGIILAAQVGHDRDPAH